MLRGSEIHIFIGSIVINQAASKIAIEQNREAVIDEVHKWANVGGQHVFSGNQWQPMQEI